MSITADTKKPTTGWSDIRPTCPTRDTTPRNPAARICCSSIAPVLKAPPANWRKASIPRAGLRDFGGHFISGVRRRALLGPIAPLPDWMAEALRPSVPKITFTGPAFGKSIGEPNAKVQGVLNKVAQAREGNRNAILLLGRVCDLRHGRQSRNRQHGRFALTSSPQRPFSPHRIIGARDRSDHSKRNGATMSFEDPNSFDPDKMVALALARARANGHSEEEHSEKPPAESLVQMFTAEALRTMIFDPIKYVVPGFIVEGLTLFAGKPKIGKSWLLTHAAWAVADGNYTLGGIACEAGDVLYAALEDNKRRLQRRMTKLFGMAPWPKRLTFVNEMPRLAEGGLKFIKAWIESVDRPRLIIIDTLAMVRMPNRKDQNSYDADYTAVKDLRDLAAEYGVAIVLVHHLRKAEADDPFDTISGTLGLTGSPRHHHDHIPRGQRSSDPSPRTGRRGHQEGGRIRSRYMHMEHRRRCRYGPAIG